MDENDKEDPMLYFEDVNQMSRDMLNKSQFDHWKVEKLEHLRLELTNIYDSPYNRDSRPKYGQLVKKEIECYDKEHVSFIEHKKKDEVPKKHHTVAVKTLKYDADLSLREIEVLGLSCIDVAHGINYLHNEMEDKKMVIHGDICSRNIEMDDNWVAKIVGFESSVIMDLNQDVDYVQVNEIIDCDKYYLDSEYAKTAKLKRESDVFSFRVVMLEILCGEWGPDITRKEGCKDNELINLARQWFNEGTIKKKVSPIIQEEY
ncbi:probable receptor-like protein kinase At2g39360 [Rutidosis leptorrhynchoides]|uniref:probable receptor-like protein kinase At2g39360 n=1 Tax=Rutidosis leptorrhynchoides TaxID=125765 RepID=UPI003A9907AE